MFPHPLNWLVTGYFTEISQRTLNFLTEQRSDNDLSRGQVGVSCNAVCNLFANQARAAQDEETLFLGQHCTSQKRWVSAGLITRPYYNYTPDSLLSYNRSAEAASTQRTFLRNRK